MSSESVNRWRRGIERIIGSGARRAGVGANHVLKLTNKIRHLLKVSISSFRISSRTPSRTKSKTQTNRCSQSNKHKGNGLEMRRLSRSWRKVTLVMMIGPALKLETLLKATTKKLSPIGKGTRLLTRISRKKYVSMQSNMGFKKLEKNIIYPQGNSIAGCLR